MQDDQVSQNIECVYICGAEEILTFKTFKGSKKQVASDPDNN
jgi:hypothetical protein